MERISVWPARWRSFEVPYVAHEGWRKLRFLADAEAVDTGVGEDGLTNAVRRGAGSGGGHLERPRRLIRERAATVLGQRAAGLKWHHIEEAAAWRVDTELAAMRARHNEVERVSLVQRRRLAAEGREPARKHPLLRGHDVEGEKATRPDTRQHEQQVPERPPAPGDLLRGDGHRVHSLRLPSVRLFLGHSGHELPDFPAQREDEQRQR